MTGVDGAARGVAGRVALRPGVDRAAELAADGERVVARGHLDDGCIRPGAPDREPIRGGVSRTLTGHHGHAEDHRGDDPGDAGAGHTRAPVWGATSGALAHARVRNVILHTFAPWRRNVASVACARTVTRCDPAFSQTPSRRTLPFEV